MKPVILILPIGEVPSSVLEYLKTELPLFLVEVKVKIGERFNIPPSAFNPHRKQYNSSLIINHFSMLQTLKRYWRTLIVVSEDTYSNNLNFVFGEALFNGPLSLISLARLNQTFYGLEYDENLLLERALKEALHELGHTLGLRHCINRKCVMYFSNTIFDTDFKGPNFCLRCKHVIDSVIKKELETKQGKV